MPDLTSLLQQGVFNLWIFIPSAILLGALHGLEPGHSKTMMAAFIVAIRGTVTQAILLGLAATASHTAVVWAVVLVGIYFFGGQFDAHTSEPYFQIFSGALMAILALWMLHRTWKHQHNFHKQHSHSHSHDHGHSHAHSHESEQALEAINVTSPEYHDPHELAHAEDIRRRFSNKSATTGQIILFGLTGGLIPCPASITVLLLCLQIKKVALGALLVLCFSVGLALTMVAAGTIAALSINRVTRKWSGFSKIARKAPYLSGILIGLIGLYVCYEGLRAIF